MAGAAHRPRTVIEPESPDPGSPSEIPAGAAPATGGGAGGALSRRSEGRWLLVGSAALLLAWWAGSSGRLEYVFPGPAATGRALWEMALDPGFWSALGLSLSRALGGLLLALSVGLAWGASRGAWPRVRAFTQPLLQLMLSTPAIIFVILVMLWLGPTGAVVPVVVAIVTSPLIAEATAQAVRGIDRDLVEMGRVFGLPRRRIAWRIITPMVVPPIVAATTVALGQSIRVTVMAELLATASGIGGALRLAQINIETPDVFAYAIVMTSLTYVLERVLVAPIRRRMTPPASS
ncbi:ABC transporter permease subunit [Actinomyces sp. B33]|uniref:ABC transporter permease n=1 Tax=Actinomyces sp. B33 TaxID=2942131 RepID=UPI0023408B91|nr:ABC transporter permease subunit [Actinomyces sp. B33]MDC4232701.1 ABC transporter permease subunit [Actinomyces sp. B33]